MQVFKKGIIVLLLGSLAILSSCNQKDPYHPDRNLSKSEQQQILLTTVRYLGHLPKNATHATKFDSSFDEYYSKLALDFSLEGYFEKDGYEYFLASRIAPSLIVKKVATGVKMQRDADGNITYYEEVFRTWKFEIPEMQEKGLMLFDKMVNGEDLSPYFPQNSGKEEYIEFPDAKVSYDVQNRIWKVNGNSNS
ncbi:hypothetical protein M3O96_08715 [Aquiflexum sp. TKW24L]|uniref:hypothetical protein n=1 Tax=Aquiflexum sp. TKW24L TaxID=2942212 RepID=UPI0020BDF441|nr:hypothetical protein [Aquiflexum sp. TKW24L]MCL6259167.1 hypothetical protein [Aquiflexum sp. TKW24L]